jgi:uncharacterized protein YecE (DUF72 family)
VGFCIHDLRGVSGPRWTTGRAVYVRFHGPTEAAYAGRYSPADLRTWARRIRGYVRDGHQVYVYFNNDDRAFAVANALELRDMVGEAPAREAATSA